MFDNFRFSGWLWGAALAFVYHSTWGKTDAPPYVSPRTRSAVRTRSGICYWDREIT